MSDAASPQAKQSWLAYFPSLSFGTVMGVTGLGLAWRRAEEMMGWSTLPGDIILLIGALILVLSIPLYGLKMARYPEIFAADIDHPIKSAFIAGLPMAMVLQVSALAPINIPSITEWGSASTILLSM